MSNNVRTKVKATPSKPKMPKVDKGALFETNVRGLFTLAVDEWCRDNIEGKVEKELRGMAVDDLIAQFGSAIETMVTSAAACYLDAAFEEDDDDPGDGDGKDDDDDNDDNDDDDDNVQDAEFEEVRRRRR